MLLLESHGFYIRHIMHVRTIVCAISSIITYFNIFGGLTSKGMPLTLVNIDYLYQDDSIFVDQ